MLNVRPFDLINASLLITNKALNHIELKAVYNLLLCIQLVVNICFQYVHLLHCVKTAGSGTLYMSKIVPTIPLRNNLSNNNLSLVPPGSPTWCCYQLPCHVNTRERETCHLSALVCSQQMTQSVLR